MSYVKDIATSTQHTVGGATSYAIPVTAAPGSGNTIILHICSTNIQAATVTDTKGNTWVKAKGQAASVGVAQFYCQQDVGTLTATDTITVAFGSTLVSYIAAILQEHSGILVPSPVDQTAGHNTTTASTTRDGGTTAATAQASEVVVASFGIAAVETSFTAGTGYSVGTNAYLPYSAGGISVEAEFSYVSATGTYNPTATGGVSATGGGVTVTYKQAAAGSTKPISGNISATSTMSGNVVAKKRVNPQGSIQATSTMNGAGSSSPASGDPDAYGTGEYGSATYGGSPAPPSGGGGTGGGGSGGVVVTPGQPTIEPPTTPTGDAIIDFIESSPPGMFPENDDSNFGFVIRGLWAAKVEDLIGQQDLLYKERFVATSDEFLDEWERMTGTPANPAGFDLTTRRAIVLGRIRKGPFTRAMRKEIIERYLSATFGGGVAFGPSGIPIGAGIKLTGGTTAPDVTAIYKVVEDIPNFIYHVYILNTYTPSDGMVRELQRVTPAGISFDVTYVATLP